MTKVDIETFVSNEELKSLQSYCETLSRKAADELYEQLLFNVQEYLIDNIKFNIGSKIDSYHRQHLESRTALEDIATVLGVRIGSATARQLSEKIFEEICNLKRKGATVEG